MRLKLSRRAEADLADIRDYSVERFGVDRAIAYLDAIEQAFRRILLYPEIGEEYPAVAPAIRSLACQRHRIFYVAEDRTIVIQRILHATMDVYRHF
ncbi:type II toxin-antitoxin system RelE/ParE family toxin [Sphingomonas sp. PB4P5]|uniref:type II toxin-antitoxin system RelE/ParE family toxin n=1 Tax=Parasphingomonas puruogangriensis TaxID=3096155 RepID=UPI002FCAA15A